MWRNHCTNYKINDKSKEGGCVEARSVVVIRLRSVRLHFARTIDEVVPHLECKQEGHRGLDRYLGFRSGVCRVHYGLERLSSAVETFHPAIVNDAEFLCVHVAVQSVCIEKVKA